MRPAVFIFMKKIDFVISKSYSAGSYLIYFLFTIERGFICLLQL